MAELEIEGRFPALICKSIFSPPNAHGMLKGNQLTHRTDERVILRSGKGNSQINPYTLVYYFMYQSLDKEDRLKTQLYKTQVKTGIL